MKRFYLIFCSFLVLVFTFQDVLSSEKFTCEKIKEKSVRKSCLNEREANPGKNVESSSFVEKAKKSLISKFKDPISAQYKGLFLTDLDSDKTRTLCGFVNAKNSYGGYTGFVSFYVHYSPNYGGDGFITWIDDGSESGDLAISGRNLAMAYCSGQSIKIPDSQ